MGMLEAMGVTTVGGVLRYLPERIADPFVPPEPMPDGTVFDTGLPPLALDAAVRCQRIAQLLQVDALSVPWATVLAGISRVGVLAKTRLATLDTVFAEAIDAGALAETPDAGVLLEIVRDATVLSLSGVATVCVQVSQVGRAEAVTNAHGFCRLTRIRPARDYVMRIEVAVYESTDTPAWLDTNAQQLLAEGRATFARFRLSDTTVLADSPDVLLFPWTGDRALFTTTIALHGKTLEASVEGPAIRIRGTSIGEVAATTRRLLADAPPAADELAASIQNREFDKWDWVLDDTLASESAGARLLDVDGAWTLLAKVAPDLADAAALTADTSPAGEN